MTYSFFIVFAYLCGSVPFGKIAGKLNGIDVQKQGSGNIGFANVVRVVGWKAGVPVLMADVLKGMVPVLWAKQYLPLHQVLVVALVAVVAHVVPIWLKGRGGKGIATGLGVTLGLSPLLGCLAIAVYLATFCVFRKSAPSSLVAALSLPLLCVALRQQYTVFYALLAVLALLTHRTNIQTMLGKV